MTENERLTIDEIIQHCNRTCENTEIMAISKGQTQEDITAKSYWEHYQVSNYLEELKQYRAIGTVEEFKALKDAEEQGLILRLPYPLGTDHIYFADEKDMDVYKLDAEKIEVHMMPISKKVMYTIDCFEFLIEDFGKIVFLTKEAAEQALEAMKGGTE